jgi:hypothetical protein
MPKCPHCKKNINHLYNDQTVWHRYSMGLSKFKFGKNVQYSPNYIELKTWSAGENIFACPECDMVLFYTEKSAFAFLQGR